MASTKSSTRYNLQSWEDSDFPILCQTCLGENPYMRMMKDKYGSECKVCERPFTCFKWCPGRKMRFKKTEICQICAKLKNVCQTCLLDLQYGLPVQVRDTMLNIPDEIPKSEVNKEYYRQNIEKSLEDSKGLATSIAGSGSKMHQNHELLVRLSRTHPYYERNRPHLCSFWAKGLCNRGEECPYRHEMPTDPNDPLNRQNIRDRYYGKEDPVAEKLLNRAAHLPKLEAPNDRSITTLYISGIDVNIGERELRDHFYQYGEISKVFIFSNNTGALVTFSTRSSAELAAESSYSKLIIKGRKLVISWHKPLGSHHSAAPGEAGGVKLQPVPGLPEVFPIPNFAPSNNSGNAETPSNATTKSSGIYYPSQDPNRMGAKSSTDK